MSEPYVNPYRNPKPYVPATLGETVDLLSSMVLRAPAFVDRTGYFPEISIDTEFGRLIEAFGRLKARLGDDNGAALVDMAERAKALFAGHPNMSADELDKGYDLLFSMRDRVKGVRRRRAVSKLRDDEGEITGD